VRRERTQKGLLDVSVSRVSFGIGGSPEGLSMRKSMIDRIIVMRPLDCGPPPDAVWTRERRDTSLIAGRPRDANGPRCSVLA